MIKRVTLAVELADGRSWDKLPVGNPAMVAWDFERDAKKWPTASDAPFLWLTFLAWRQLVNMGEYPATEDPGTKGGRPVSTFPTFRDRDCDAVDEVSKKDKRSDDDVDPTQQGAELSSASP